MTQKSGTRIVKVRFDQHDSKQVCRDERDYDIHIGSGLLGDLKHHLVPFLKRPWVTIVTDENVAVAQGKHLTEGLTRANIDYKMIVLKPGEETKSFTQLQKLTSQLLDYGVERDDIVIAFGGGVIGDLTGFACAILRRGCAFVQIPTTLLAQVDSSVGGKTAINASQGKNLIGAFHQPRCVLIDIECLDTLPSRERQAGYAEIVKYALINDRDFFDWLHQHGAKILDNDPGALIHAIATSCEKKAAIVSEDEKEAGKRALLNLGHTFGHALEGAFGYSDALLHGEAVGLGMVLAFAYSAELGLCSTEEAKLVQQHMSKMGLPSDLQHLKKRRSETLIAHPNHTIDLSPNHLVTLMTQDKKTRQGKITLILPKAIGQAEIYKNQSAAKLRDFWQRHLTK